MKRTAIALSGLIFLISCDCYQEVSGTVVDNVTGKPLQDVTVYNKKKNWRRTVTDSTGHFELSNVSGGSRCPPMSVVVEKVTYETMEVSIPSGDQRTIKMIKTAH